MKTPERILVWLLRVGGAVMLTALGAVVMPSAWINVIHQQTRLGELPHVPLVGYLTRSISALYALHGALLVFIASDVRRYLPVVRFLAVAGAVFGARLLFGNAATVDGRRRAVCDRGQRGDSLANRAEAFPDHSRCRVKHWRLFISVSACLPGAGAWTEGGNGLPVLFQLWANAVTGSAVAG